MIEGSGDWLHLEFGLVTMFLLRLGRFLISLIHARRAGGALDAFAFHQFFHGAELETREFLFVRGELRKPLPARKAKRRAAVASRAP